MDCKKTGRLIFSLRKEKKMTQKELAEKLNITDRAVSKWERGLGAPDVSLLRPLSEVLEVSINEILTGEKNTIKKYSELSEEKTILEKIGLIIVLLLLLIPIVLINWMLIATNIRLDYICLIFGSIFLSLLIFLKINNNQELKRKIVIAFVLFYISSLFIYTFYTGIIYSSGGLVDVRNGVELIPLLPILQNVIMVINGTQKFCFLFEYVIVDFCMFIPCSLFIPYLVENKIKRKRYFMLLLLIILLKELLQLLLNVGMFDINDIILNFLGVITVYYLLKGYHIF